MPQNLAATAVSSSQIDLTWDPSTDNVAVTGYNIYRDDVLVDTSPTNAYSDTGLAPGTMYQYEVSAIDAASNESARSAPDSATTHQAIVTAGLIAEWRFDDGAGQVLTDYAGGFHGQLGSTTGADAADPTWTAHGLSFDGGGRVVLPSLPAIRGVDIIFNSDFTINAPSPARVLLSNIRDGQGTGIVLGSWTGSLTNEIISIGQDTAQAYSNFHRRAWTHASESVAAGGWHLLQFDVRPAPEYYNLVLDGVNKANVTVNTPEVWKAGIWSIADGVAGGGNGFAGDVAYVIFYSTARSDALQAQNRAALAAILAARGITLP